MSDKNVRIVNVYTVKDNVADEFGPPYLGVNDAVALRSFYQMFKDVKGVDANDYSLYLVGYFNLGTGDIIGIPATIVQHEVATKLIMDSFQGAEVVK